MTVMFSSTGSVLLDLGHESGSTNNIEGGDTEKTLGVVNSFCLEDLCNDRNCGVHWVGDNKDVCIGSRFSSGFGEISDNGGIGVEEIIAGHAWLSWDTGWD